MSCAISKHIVHLLRLGALIQACAVAACWLCVSDPAQGQSPYTPAPRTVEDILTLLDRYKLDPAARGPGTRQKAFRAAAELPPSTDDPATLRSFYRKRARAANRIGLVKQRIEDLQQSAKYGRAAGFPYNILTELYNAELSGGNFLNAVKIMEEIANSAPKDWEAMESYTELASAYALLGESKMARGYLAKAEQARSDMSMPGKRRGGRGNFSYRTHQFDSRLEHARGDVLSSEGKFVEAEAAYRKAIAEAELDLGMRDMRAQRGSGEFEEDFESVRDNYLSLLAVALMRQFQLSEAEIVARQVLEHTLRRTGRYSVDAANAVRLLATIVFEQGRYQESGLLAAAAIESFVNAGAAPESLNLAAARKVLGGALVAQRRWSDALENYGELYRGLQHDPDFAQRYGAGDTEWALALVKTGHAAESVEMLEGLLARLVRQFGDADVQVAEARGYLGLALAAQGGRERALIEFRRAVPVLLDQARAQQASETGGIVRTMRLINVLEAYLDLLAESYQAQQGNRDPNLLAESFRVADAARGGNVQRALAESAARASLPDQDLAVLARQEQDAQQRVGVLSDLLSRLLSAPPDQQLPSVVADARKEIEALRASRTKLRQEIEKRFPDYANLTNPKPATIEQASAALRPGEALISIYVGEDRTYVWAIPKQGAPAFAVVPFGEKAIAGIVTQLRKALDVGGASLERFPKFDVAVAYKLYSELLAPVEPGWKGASSLLIVPHRTLGQLPFGVLVTAPAEVVVDSEIRFAGYKSVPWLLRNAAITQLPSVNTLVTLRSIPATKANRREFIGFGDPYFTKEQQAEAAKQASVDVAMVSRGVRLRNLTIEKVAAPAAVAPGEDRATATPAPTAPAVANSSMLAQLARLPDTAVEIKEIAQTLNADIDKDVFLGAQANEKNVKTMNLANRKVIAFATHGLAPGDLNGLEQPALALSAPEVAGVGGDGLLTMDEILALKLDADWVVLSACNTASGEGAESEAVSGLGRAFFYAGTRALLVSNWPVETVSARLLTTDLFRRQAQNPSLTRAEALRQTMLKLMDGPGAVVNAVSDKPLYSYAHPMFWAPFSLVGDGG